MIKYVIIFYLLIIFPEAAYSYEILNGDLSVTIAHPEDLLALHPDDSRDWDKDGLADEAENMLAQEFFPVVLFDSSEDARFDLQEPHVLYQVTPIKAGSECVVEDSNIIVIKYQFVFSHDYGWGDHCEHGEYSHRGDNERLSVVLKFLPDDGKVVFLYSLASASNDNDQYLCNISISDGESNEIECFQEYFPPMFESNRPCEVGTPRTYWSNNRYNASRDDSAWFAENSDFFTASGWHGNHFPLFFAEDKHHIYLHRWKQCYTSWNHGEISQEERANGEEFDDFDYFETLLAESFNVGEKHTKDWYFEDLSQIAGDAYFSDYFDISDWPHNDRWDDEHFWKTTHFMGDPDTSGEDGYPTWEGCSPLADAWRNSSPWNSEGEIFNFDGDMFWENFGQSFDDWYSNFIDLVPGEITYLDMCPFEEGDLEQLVDSDGDGWGDACDTCPTLAASDLDPRDQDEDALMIDEDNCPCVENPSQEDLDGDGLGDVCDPDLDGDDIPNEDDNCVDVPNTDQLNCDNDVPPVGDACDSDYCAYFCGAGVQSIVSHSFGNPYSAGIFIVSGTYTKIKTEYCAVGPADAPAPLEKHDAQLRWCDCDGEDDADCEDDYCKQISLQYNYQNHFSHGGWHTISYDPENVGSSIFAPGTIPQPPVEAGADARWYPSTTCSRNFTWSTWGQDLGLGTLAPTNPWYTYHCAPEFVTYRDPNDEVESYKTNWIWSRELWWHDTLVSAPTPPEKKAGDVTGEFGNGFVWLRPEYPTRPYVTGANKYTDFTLSTMSVHVFGGLKALPYFYFLIPPVEDRWADDVYGRFFPGVRSPLVALFAMSVEQSAMAGKFAYSTDVMGTDAAVGGLVVMVADGASLQPRSIAYSIGSGSGSVPNTTGFAAAQFSVDTQLQTLDTFAAESAGVGQGRMRGVIAAFGGTLASGQLGADLWFGTFGGIDQDGTPFFTWAKAPVQSGQAPTGRTGAGMAYDKAANRLLLFGGKSTNNGPATDMWSYDLGRQTWSLLDQSFPDVSGFAVAQGGSRVFVASGDTSNGTASTKVLMLSLANGMVTEIGDLSGGPGARTSIALAYAASRAGKLLVFGGTDSRGVVQTDVWEYDIASEAWSQRMADCATGTCPSGTASLLVTNKQGLDLGVYSVGRTGNEMFFVVNDAGEWAAAAGLAEKTPTQDCNADGVLDPESSRACRVSDLWYAPVERQRCALPGGGETTMCLADEPKPMTALASWQPDGWEWIVDMAPGPDGYTYIVTDGALYTFDSRDAAEGLEPLDVDEFGCWSGADWGIDAELIGGYLYVGAWSGVHVFSLEDPENPQEIGYTPSYGPVLDMVLLENALYLADGHGITVLDVSDPTLPVEAKRVSLGTKLALKVGVDEETRGLLVLTLATLERFSVQANPANPVFAKRIFLLGALMTEMKVDGRWAYFNGLLSTETVFWNGQTLAKKGQHDLRDWTDSRVLRDGMAERVQPFNEYEVWAE